MVAEPARIRATLLVVDDDANVVASLVRFLGEAGYRVLAAGSGAEAEAILAQIEPDLIGQPAPTLVTVKDRGYALVAHSAARRGTGS